jgi:hypothetical protein
VVICWICCYYFCWNSYFCWICHYYFFLLK